MHSSGIFAEFQLIKVAINKSDPDGMSAMFIEVMRQHLDKAGLSAEGAASKPTEGDKANEEKCKCSHRETLAVTVQNSMPRY